MLSNDLEVSSDNEATNDEHENGGQERSDIEFFTKSPRYEPKSSLG